MPPFTHTFPVRFADVDHAGIVYYPRFYHYFHVAFEEFFRQRMGATAYVDLLDRRRIGFPAVRSECDYRLPLRFGDQVRAEMSIDRLGGKSIHFRYRLYRVEGETQASAGGLCAEGSVVCVVTDLAHFRGVEIPDDLRPLFLELMGGNE
jgi:4-hydroxybenzoyl-CoA thioesterase